MIKYLYCWRQIMGSSTEGYHSFRVKYKMNKQPQSLGIVSSCIFGDINQPNFMSRYIEPLIKNCKLINNILPKWCMRVYADPNIPKKMIQMFIDNGCEVYIMEKESIGTIGTMWRFLPASETKPFITYDADMYLNESSYAVPNLKESVNKWLKTDKVFFQRSRGILNYFIPICAGMWGAKPTKEGNAPIPDIQQKLEKYKSSWYGCDEAFLTKEIYPLFKANNNFLKIRCKLDIIFGLVLKLFLILMVIFFLYNIFIDDIQYLNNT